MTKAEFKQQVSTVAGITQATAGHLYDFLLAKSEESSNDRLSELVEELTVRPKQVANGSHHGRMAISILAAAIQALRFGSIRLVQGKLATLSDHLKPDPLANVFSHIAHIIQREHDFDGAFHVTFPLRCLGYAQIGIDIRKALKDTFDTMWQPEDEQGRDTTFDSYSEAKRKVQQHLAWRVPAADYLLVDYVWLPELIASGNVEPIDRRHRAVGQELAQWEQELCGDLEGVPKQLLQGLLDRLCWSNCDSIYCLPLTLNWHGYLPPKAEAGVSFPSTFDDQLRDSNIWSRQRTVVQNQPSACLAYEFWAHCAYFGITLLETSPDNAQITLGLSPDPDANNPGICALTSLLFRIRRGLQNMQDDDLKNDQAAQKKHLEDSTNPWYPTITHEVWQLGQKTEPFNVPLSRAGTPDYLTCFGGFGIAISRNTRDCYRASEQLIALAKNLPNLPDGLYAFISEAGDKIAKHGNSNVEQWIARHTRLRIAFWTRVEEVLSAWVEDVLRNPKLGGGSGEYVALKSEIAGAWSKLYQKLFRRLRVTANNAGWEVSGG